MFTQLKWVVVSKLNLKKNIIIICCFMHCAVLSCWLPALPHLLVSCRLLFHQDVLPLKPMQSDVISDFPTFGLINVCQRATTAAVGHTQHESYLLPPSGLIQAGSQTRRTSKLETYFFLQVIRFTLNRNKNKYTHIKLYHICNSFIGWYLHLGLLHCYYTSYTVSRKEV